jgi:hypothetical protein
MQYPLDELDFAIDYFLSLNKNKWFSENVIYNDLQKLDICPELHKPEKRAINKRIFKSTCRSMQLKFNNIVTYTSNKNVIHLKFDTTLETTVDEEEDDSEFETAFELAKQTKNPFTTFGNSTVIHEVCRTGDIDMLDQLFMLASVDIFRTNDDGETLLSTIDIKHINARKMLGLLNLFGGAYTSDMQFEIRQKREELQVLQCEIKILRKQLVESQDRITTCLWTTFIMTILFGLSLVFAYFGWMREIGNVDGECMQE